jgi:Domain of Unknown Function (DUF1080)
MKNRRVDRWAVLAAATVTVSASMSSWGEDYCDTEVPVVKPGTLSPTGMTPPSDAIVLFDGRDLSHWKGKSGAAMWEVKDGIMTVKTGTGDIQSTQSFHDIQLHIEWRIPPSITGEGQHRGNSGVFLNDRYEIQILDSYQHRTYADGQAGAVYGQVAPLVNAMRPPGEWNAYDVMFTAPRFYDNGAILTPARVTVLHNGVLIQNNAEILGATGAWGEPGYHTSQESGPIRLQDHPGAGEPVSFRNIWVRNLNAPVATAVDALPSDSATSVVSKKTVRELIDNPATRAVLYRCVPELVPNPANLDYVGKRTLGELRGELDISLSDSKLKIIEEQLSKALSAADR